MSILRISRTISRIRSKPRFRPARSLHAAPIQKRVLPFDFALRAASNTGSISSRREAFVAVVYLDDCEQYEPEYHEHDPDWRLSGAFASQSSLQPPPASKHQNCFRGAILELLPLTLDVHQRAQLDFDRIVVLPMHARRAEDEVQQRGFVNPLHFLFSPVVTRRGCRYWYRRGGRCMRRKRSRQESETRRCDDAQH
jgi:hypothetical protein